MAQVVRKEMRTLAPSKTGKLKKNLKYTTKRERSGGFTAKVGAFNDAYYAKFIEGGAKAHTIPSKKGRRAKKGVSLGGKFYSQINHPGIRARPFIARALRQSQSRAIKEGGKVMFRLLAK